MKTTTVLTLALFAVLATSFYAEAKGNAPESSDWESFKNFHGKMYASDAHEAKFRANFEKNAKAIAVHNAAFEAGKVTYKRELNSFTDQDPKDFARIRHGYKPKNRTTRAVPTVFKATSNFKRQSDVSCDWRDKGMVSPVKDQGQCGSCWAFSSTGAMESQGLMKGQSFILSEQQLVDCDQNDNGCGGGIFENAWQSIEDAGGIDSEDSYPYSSGDGNSGTCSFSSANVAATISGSQQVDLDVDSICQALCTYGPLSVSVDATDFQTYSQGLLCSGNNNNDHAVLLVGCGTDSDSGQGYFLIKNSWGENWGEQGYVRVCRDDGQNCGITGGTGSNVAYPQIG